MLVAKLSPFNQITQIGIQLLVLLSLFLVLLFNPRSVALLSQQAYSLHKRQNLEAAMEIYETILQIEPENEFARQNLKQIKVKFLSDEAYDLHEKGDYKKALRLYQEILIIDPENDWAKDNMRLIAPSDSNLIDNPVFEWDSTSVD